MRRTSLVNLLFKNRANVKKCNDLKIFKFNLSIRNGSKKSQTTKSITTKQNREKTEGNREPPHVQKMSKLVRHLQKNEQTESVKYDVVYKRSKSAETLPLIQPYKNSRRTLFHHIKSQPALFAFAKVSITLHDDASCSVEEARLRNRKKETSWSHNEIFTQELPHQVKWERAFASWKWTRVYFRLGALRYTKLSQTKWNPQGGEEKKNRLIGIRGYRCYGGARNQPASASAAGSRRREIR